MESSHKFFCHTCKKDFTLLVFNEDEVLCPTCNECFVEMIEDESQLSALKELYKSEQTQQNNLSHNNSKSAQNQQQPRKSSHESDEFYECHDNEDSLKTVNKDPNEEEKKEESQTQQQQQQQQQQTNNQQQQRPQVHTQTFQTNNGSARITASVQNINLNGFNGQDPNWINNLSSQINNIMRSQGQTTTVNQNGQNINVTTVHGQAGDTEITIANIEEDIGDGEEGEEWEDVDEEGELGDNAEIQQVNIDIDIDAILDENLNNAGSQQPNQPNQQQNQQQNQNQQQQNQHQQQPFNFQNIFGNLLGGVQGQHPPIINQFFNIGQPQGAAGNQNVFNIFNGLGNFGNFGEQMDQNILNQVLEQSILTAMNNPQGIPTSKSFIEKMHMINGSDLMQKKECQVCFEHFKDEDKLYKLPCKHLYHKDCIMPWLEKHNTCPSCRYELPTDDLEYENKRKQTPNDPLRDFLNGPNNNRNNPNGGNNNNGAGGNSGNTGASGSNNTFNSTYHA